MKEYWDDIITSQSWEKLVEINKQYDFVLIGGWAVWLYTRALKSKDIDIIVSFEELSKLKDNFALHKNARLSKYEIKELNYDIDVYVEHFSNLGLPAEAIAKESQDLDGFTVPKPEMLLIAKQCAFRDRQGSIKGEKDKIDIYVVNIHTIKPIDEKLIIDLKKTFPKLNSLLKPYNCMKKIQDTPLMMQVEHLKTI